MSQGWRVWNRNPSEPGFADYTYVVHSAWDDEPLEFPVIRLPGLTAEALQARFPFGCSPSEANALVEKCLREIERYERTLAAFDRAQRQVRETFKKFAWDEMVERVTEVQP